MPRFLFHPFDTLFFRDGRPFEQEDEGMADVRSLFPPFPGVLGGALRAALARAQGWGGTADWSNIPAHWNGQSTTLGEVLGKGVDPGRLYLGPPAVVQCVGGSWRRLYPAPQHLLRGKTPQGSALTLLAPSPVTRGLLCDLDAAKKVRLPDLLQKVEGAKPLPDTWLTPAGMAAILAGRRPGPDEMIETKDLWQHEYRVGLQRDTTTRTAVTGMLYAGSHVRLKEGVALGIKVEGLAPDWMPQSPALLGGSQRLAKIERGDWKEADHGPARAEEPFVVVLTGPMKPRGPGWRTPEGELDPQLLSGFQVVAACVERPVMIGGWDSLAHGPRALQPYLRAGSVFFLEGNGAPVEWPAALGEDTKQGYGRYLVGRWPDGGAP